MDVTQSEYRSQLLSILKNIAAAKFITFDLEMSGIRTRPRYGTGDRSQDLGKPTLQQQYQELRSAAELYQVVQVGITCVEENAEKGFYLARPYNFNLSPLLADGISEANLKLERNFTFSTATCDFLKKNHFDFGRMFTEGIPYLSQHEQKDLEAEYTSREHRNAKIPDISVPANDAVNLKFVRKARKDISDWVNDPKHKDDYLNISNERGPIEEPMDAFQRRLIYQLIKKEFPTLRTFPRQDSSFMRVEKLDVRREQDYQRRRLEQQNYFVCKQTGLRWIFEALSGGDLSGLQARYFVNSSENYDEEVKAATIEFKAVVEALKIKKHIIVGHNLFTDLAFLYSTFVGTLPDDVHLFQTEIHKRFPIVFDTKYIATEGNGSNNARHNLREILESFKKSRIPSILLHEDHTSYGGVLGKDHEAGFDSWMTAELFVKLTAKLHSEKPHLSEDDSTSEGSEYISPDEDNGGASLNGRNQDSLLDNLPSEWHAKELNNRFAVLAFDTISSEPKEKIEKEKKVEQWIPKMSSGFWDIYINKLRVYASDCGVCDLEDGY